MINCWMQEIKVWKYHLDLMDNLLRYEMRLSCGLPKQIGVEEVKASTLSDKAFFMKLLKMWGDEYFTISKHKTMREQILKMKSKVPKVQSMLL